MIGGEEYLLIDLEEFRVKSKFEVDVVVFWEDFLFSLLKGMWRDEL